MGTPHCPQASGCPEKLQGVRLVLRVEEDLHRGLETLQEHKLPSVPSRCQADTQFLSHNIVMAEGLDKCHKADFTISFQVEGKEVVHKEAAICLSVTEESQRPLLGLVWGGAEKVVEFRKHRELG